MSMSIKIHVRIIMQWLYIKQKNIGTRVLLKIANKLLV